MGKYIFTFHNHKTNSVRSYNDLYIIVTASNSISYSVISIYGIDIACNPFRGVGLAHFGEELVFFRGWCCLMSQTIAGSAKDE